MYKSDAPYKAESEFKKLNPGHTIFIDAAALIFL